MPRQFGTKFPHIVRVLPSEKNRLHLPHGSITHGQQMYVHFRHPEGSFRLIEGTDLKCFSALVIEFASTPSLRDKTGICLRLKAHLEPPTGSEEDVRRFHGLVPHVITFATTAVPFHSEITEVRKQSRLECATLDVEGRSYVLCQYSSSPTNPFYPLPRGEAAPRDVPKGVKTTLEEPEARLPSTTPMSAEAGRELLLSLFSSLLQPVVPETEGNTRHDEPVAADPGHGYSRASVHAMEGGRTTGIVDTREIKRILGALREAIRPQASDGTLTEEEEQKLLLLCQFIIDGLSRLEVRDRLHFKSLALVLHKVVLHKDDEMSCPRFRQDEHGHIFVKETYPLPPQEFEITTVDERIIRIGVWCYELEPLKVGLYKMLRSFGDLASFHRAYSLGDDEYGYSHLSPPQHFCITLQSTSGEWFLLGKNEAGVEWRRGEEDDVGCPLPCATIRGYEEDWKHKTERSSPFRLLRFYSALPQEIVVFAAEGDAGEEEPRQQPRFSDTLRRSVTVGDVLRFVMRDQYPVGTMPYLGANGMLLLTGIPFPQEAEAKAQVRRYLYVSSHSFIYELLYCLFGIEFDLEPHFDNWRLVRHLPYP